MSNDWLTVQSFRQMEQVLAAINIVSLQIKLNLLGANSPFTLEEYSDSLSYLQEFTLSVKRLLEEARERDDLVILGTNPRMRQFASQFLTEQDFMLEKNPLDDFPLDELQDLLKEDSGVQQIQLLSFLESLRSLVEQHVYEDTTNIFGEG